MDLLLKIFGGLTAIVGAIVVFAAKPIAKAAKMEEKQTVNLETDEETLMRLKLQKAIVKVKIIGGIIFLPGMLIILYVFR